MTTNAPAADVGLMSGFGVVFRKEMLESRRSKRFLIFTGIMTLVAVAGPLIAYYNVDTIDTNGRLLVGDEEMRDIMGSIAGIFGYLGALMVIGSTMDAVPRERGAGIIAWIVTKPVSRTAYLTAKAAGYAVMSAVSVVIIPCTVWLVMMMALFENVPLDNGILSACVLLLEAGFLAFVVTALGVPLRTVAPIAIVALAFWFLPTILPAVASLEWTVYVLPSYLPIAAILAAYDPSEDAKALFTIPLASAAIGAGVFIAALWMFEQQEL